MATFSEEYVQPDDGSESLIGVDSNAGNIMGFVARTLQRAGNPASVKTEYYQLAMSGDYDHLIAVSMAYLDGDAGMLERL